MSRKPPNQVVLIQEHPWPGWSTQGTPTPLGAAGDNTSALTHWLSLISEASSCFTQQLTWIFSSGSSLYNIPAFWELQLMSLCIRTRPVQSLLPASQPCLQLRGLLMESSFHAGFGCLLLLPHALCEPLTRAAHQEGAPPWTQATKMPSHPAHSLVLCCPPSSSAPHPAGDAV